MIVDRTFKIFKNWTCETDDTKDIISKGTRGSEMITCTYALSGCDEDHGIT